MDDMHKVTVRSIRIKSLLWSLLWSAALLAVTIHSTAIAAVAGEHQGGHAEVSLLWPTLNFAIYLAILGYLIQKKVNPALKARATEVEQLLQRAARDINSAKEELAQRETRRKGIAQEQQLIRQRLEQEGDRIAQDVLKNGEAAANAARADVSKRVDRELKRASADVRQLVIEGSAKRARELLRQTLSPEDDRRLRQEAINGLFE